MVLFYVLLYIQFVCYAGLKIVKIEGRHTCRNIKFHRVFCTSIVGVPEYVKARHPTSLVNVSV